MECKAKIINISKGIESGYSVMLALEDVGIAELQKLQGIDLRLKADKWREMRSKTANAYFHVLVHKIATVITRSDAYVKNDLIAQAGFCEFLDDIPAVIKSNVEPERMMELEQLHTKVFKVDVDTNGSVVYWYKIYRGSHTYNTAEMSRLIDLTVQQAKDLDIETLDDIKTRRMLEAWEQDRKAL